MEMVDECFYDLMEVINPVVDFSRKYVEAKISGDENSAQSYKNSWELAKDKVKKMYGHSHEGVVEGLELFLKSNEKMVKIIEGVITQ
ncbi:hypothetical protein CMI38_00290 [Candidatus Pacearchaeota archaeon]|jgi:hypothetical protein|nr:hypothetical protein [Candidatus Pacearchaeota archaeon]|tara:strand:- start:5037 stop:5297 length:261 start_codon:yes stop_codon:yes gene_type:complete